MPEQENQFQPFIVRRLYEGCGEPGRMPIYIASIDTTDGNTELTRDPRQARIFQGRTWVDHWSSPDYAFVLVSEIDNIDFITTHHLLREDRAVLEVALGQLMTQFIQPIKMTTEALQTFADLAWGPKDRPAPEEQDRKLYAIIRKLLNAVKGG